MPNNYILIDGSYYIFYRYYALNVWLGHQGAIPSVSLALAVGALEAMPPVELVNDEKSSTNPSYVNLPRPQAQVKQTELLEKFKSTFVSKINEIDKKLKLKNTIKYVGKDCRRSEIWRTALYPEYKGTRITNNDFLGAELFKLAYGGSAPIPPVDANTTDGIADINNGGSATNPPVGTNPTNILYGDDVTIPPTASGIADTIPPTASGIADALFEKAGVKQILSYPSLEADDCIALTAKHLYRVEPDAHIWIIASDMDYLQITNDRIHLYDLKFKNICEKSSGNPLQDLFCKIVAGDKSDNIPPVFKKCGIKTAQKYFKDKELFEKKLAADKTAQEIYKLNTTLVDFNSIPNELVEGFTDEFLLNICKN